MTKENLFEAIGGIEDDVLILGDVAASGQNNVTGILSRQKTDKRFSLNAKRYAAAAACLIVVALGAIVFRGISSKWRMGSSAPNMAMQADGMIEEPAEEEMDLTMSYATSEKTMTFGGYDTLDYLISSNVAIHVSEPDQENGQVELSEEARNQVLGSLENDTVVEGEATSTEEATESLERGTVPTAGGQPTADAQTNTAEGTALYILTFEQSDTTYTATLYDDKTLVFDDDAMETIFLTEEDFDRLITALENTK